MSSEDRHTTRARRRLRWLELSLLSAAVLAVSEGQNGRRSAAVGVSSLAVTATVVNAAVKPLARRRRPDRLLAGDLIGTTLVQLTAHAGDRLRG